MKPVPAELSTKSANPFSKEIPNLQILWDSTSLGDLKRCPRYYQLRMLEGRETKLGSIHLTFGILYHKALEEYDKRKIAGDSHEDAQMAAVRVALEQSVEHYSVRICTNCHRKYDASIDRDFCPACNEDLPAESEPAWRDLLLGLSQKGRVQLTRSVIWYTEQYKHDAMETVQLSDGRAAVELSFTLPLDFGPQNSSESYALRGHLDRIAKNESGTWIPDRKTTKGALYDHYFQSFSPHNQVTLYTLAGRTLFDIPVNGVIIDAVQVGVSFARFQRGYTERTVSQLEEWLYDLQLWLEQAEKYAIQDHWPQNELACGLYGGCPFRHVCGRSPEVRQKYLDNDFVYRIWNPAEDR